MFSKMWTYIVLVLVPLATYFYMAKKGQTKSKDCEKGGELVKAAMKKDLSDVNRLLEAGYRAGECDEQGNTALGAACCSGALAIVHRMLEAKADLEHKNDIGTTPLWCALQVGQQSK